MNPQFEERLKWLATHPKLIAGGLVLFCVGFIGLYLWISSDSGPAEAPGVFHKRKEPAMKLFTAESEEYERNSSTDVLPWLSKGAKPPAEAPAAAAAPAGGTDAAAAAPAPSPKAGTENLSAEEKAALAAAGLGSWNEEAARTIGARRGMLFTLGEKLLKYPKLVSLILNNDLVIAGFMSQDRVKKNCEDAHALMNYLSDTKNPNGINAGLASISASLETPGSAQAIFGSKLAGAVMKQCSSINVLTHDRDMTKTVALANPQMLNMMTDTRLISGLSVSPTAMATFRTTQATLTAPAPAR